LEYNALSNVAGGEYQGTAEWAAKSGGWVLSQIPHEILGGYRPGQWWYAGAAAVALAVVAPVVARRWFATPYFAFICVVLLVLTLRNPTPLHSLFYVVLPRFELLHSHEPNRVLIVFYLGVALLAGATINYLQSWHGRPALLAITAAIMGAVLMVGARLLDRLNAPISQPAQLAFITVMVLIICYAYLGDSAARRLIPVLLLVVVLWDSVGRAATGGPSRYNELAVDLATYVQPSDAARFLSKQSDQPFRFIGHDPDMASAEEAMQGGYRRYLEEPNTVPLLVNNRATLVGLEDIQGYNPVHLQRYVEYMTALNGQEQNYHETNVLPEGVGSPLFDLLNVKYLVVSAKTAPDRSNLQLLGPDRPVVYEDSEVKVVENVEALPRAWIVHEVRQLPRGEALALLATGRVNPRQIALLEQQAPEVAPSANPERERVSLTVNAPDRIQLKVQTDAPGLLLISQSYDPSWHVDVNGEPTELYVANHALQAVPVPAGESSVVLRYESPMLRLGTVISAVTAILLTAFGAILAVQRVVGWRTHRALGAPIE